MNSLIKKIEKYFYPLGMIGVFFFLLHTVLGNILWPEYNPVTTYVSALTCDIAPNATILKYICLIYNICIILMLIAIVAKTMRDYNVLLRMGYVTLLLMELISAIGYAVFPMKGYRLDFSFQNIMHSSVTYTVVFFTFAASILVSIGYFRQVKTKKLGKGLFLFSILLALFGVLYFVSLFLKLNILGLVQRLIIYTIMAFIFVLSFYYTFRNKDEGKDRNYGSIQRT